MTKHWGVALLVMAALGGVALLVMAGLTWTNGLNGVQAAEPQGTGPEYSNDQVFSMVFLAVLEGLYLDGASNEVVDAIICPDPKTGQPQFHKHFVDACPLCNPTFNALLVYRSRPSFYGYQKPKDTLGPGLKPELVKQLRSAKRAERLAAIQSLVETWVRRRLDSLALTADQRAAWASKLEEGRKQGMERLKQSQAQGHNADWKGCAICDGAFAGSRLPGKQ